MAGVSEDNSHRQRRQQGRTTGRKARVRSGARVNEKHGMKHLENKFKGYATPYKNEGNGMKMLVERPLKYSTLSFATTSADVSVK